MNRMQRIFRVSGVIALAVLLGAPAAKAQIVVDIVDVVQQEEATREWVSPANDNDLFSHFSRPESNLVLAQCLQDALASGDHPDIEAAWAANLTYCQTALPLTVQWAIDNDWNTNEDVYLVFRLMLKSTDATAQQDLFTEWWVGWSNAFAEGLVAGDISNTDLTAQASVEAMFDTCLAGPPPPPPVPKASITRDGAIDDAFVLGSATWSVEFDEDVQFVTNDDFVIVDSGDAAHSTGPTVTANSASSYTVAVGGVTGAAGSVSLNFLGNDVESIGTGELAPAVNGPQYTNLPLPAANFWALILVAFALTFAAAIVIRKNAVKH